MSDFVIEIFISDPAVVQDNLSFDQKSWLSPKSVHCLLAYGHQHTVTIHLAYICGLVQGPRGLWRPTELLAACRYGAASITVVT